METTKPISIWISKILLNKLTTTGKYYSGRKHGSSSEEHNLTPEEVKALNIISMNEISSFWAEVKEHELIVINHGAEKSEVFEISQVLECPDTYQVKLY